MNLQIRPKIVELLNEKSTYETKNADLKAKIETISNESSSALMERDVKIARLEQENAKFHAVNVAKITKLEQEKTEFYTTYIDKIAKLKQEKADILAKKEALLEKKAKLKSKL